MTIAFCTNKNQYKNNNCQIKEKCDYPGMRWLHLLYSSLKNNQIEFISGDVALNLIGKNKLAIQDILVIQEENSKDAKELLKLGANPFLIYSWESPIYASFFYDKLKYIASKFSNRIFFNFAFDIFDTNSGNNYLMYFPTFSKEDKFYNYDWNKRKFLVMVSANKSANRKLSQNKNIKEFIYHFYKYLSSTFKKSIKKELHQERTKIIMHFKDKLDLYGLLWDDLSNFNEKIKYKLKPILNKIKPQFCENKIKTISKYKFCICSENVDYDGYITEKIIDCFIAGVIPIYIGTKYIENVIPKNIYINYSEFKNLQELEVYLENMTEEKANEMIIEAQKFLKSKDGLKFSNEYFVDKILKMMELYDN